MTIAARYKKKSATIRGLKMSYIEEGEGDPIVFLHGNPTSSYLWRNIMPHLEGRGRLIAPDLIGMGDSEKLPESGPDSYTFKEHRSFLHDLLAYLMVDRNVTLIVHDWGSALGFDWAYQNQSAIKSIAYMEAIVQPIPSWDNWPEAARNIFQAFRSPAGEELVLEKNIFVERVLPTSIIRTLEEEEQREYTRPFRNAGEDRRPTLTWPRQIPIAGEPDDVVKIVDDYSNWLSKSDLPKLFVNADPGSILVGPQREFCRTWPNQTEVTVNGLHFIQEDSPDEIGQAIAEFLAKI
ncbi:haloalkane dehalogenase [uncultured Sneathiella sp.]|uniref:haloalkane dehalogenase n=1 Tax=uncultured Sneathiella sp. TaxID=879315 RepID=UPI0030ECFD2E|tara:strand:- start:347 stop:1225 length:879 start_codon:yes stop_codon:yes gene_type:complete